MKKFITVLLIVILAACFACAQAGTLTDADLPGSWYTEYEGLIPIHCFLYEDRTFEAAITEDLPIEEMSIAGTWEYDGETLILHCENSDLSFLWNGQALTGELFGLQVELCSEWSGDMLESSPEEST